MSSGIAINQECIDAYSALSKRDNSTVILKIGAKMDEINVDKVLPPCAGDPEKEWKEVVASLPEDDCRFIITDFSWKDTPTVVSSKIIMILWSSETAPIRSKMIYASSKEAVTAKMSVQKNIEVTELEDISYNAIKTSVCK